MAGRIGIDDVAPVVSGGRFPGQGRRGRDRAGAGDGVARRPRRGVGHPGGALPRHGVSAAGRRSARARHDRTEPVPIEDVVTPAPRKKPQLLPMSTGRTPDVFHGQFSPDSVGLWTFRVDGWGDPIATWRKNVTAKLDAGQSEGELSNDLLVGARLLERAATGVPRQDRYPADRRRGPAARARRPVHPRGRRAGTRSRPNCSSSIRCANWSPAASNTASGWTGRWPGSARGTRSSPGPPAAGTPRATRCTAPSRPRPRRCRASPRWASTSCTCRRSIRSARCTARAATTA